MGKGTTRGKGEEKETCYTYTSSAMMFNIETDWYSKPKYISSNR